MTTTLAGATAQMNEAFGGLFFSMGVAILVVYIVMVLALGSLLTPFIILFSLPLALIGAIPALLITGNPLGISAMIGFLMLIGIVVTNAIVLLDFVEQLRGRGVPTTEALVQGGQHACPAHPHDRGGDDPGAHAGRHRPRPWVDHRRGAGDRRHRWPLLSTFLTLMVIPVIYSLVDGGKAGFRGRFLRSGTDAAETPSGALSGQAG